MSYDGKKLTIDNKNCNHCMHCINLMPQALRIGTETGATLLLGSHAPILEGAQMSWVIVPFMRMEAPFDEFMELVGNIHEWWSENGKNRERVGELMLRLGMRNFFQAVGLEPPGHRPSGPPGPTPSSSGMQKISRPRPRAASTSNCKAIIH